MTFSERLDNLLKEKHLTKTALADTLDIRRPTISEWKKNGNYPKGDIAIKIAQFLGVTVEYLLSGTETTETKNEISDSEMELIKLWRTLSEEKKEALKMLMRG